MPKPETNAGAIARLIRTAFVKANAGDREGAISHWKSAINKGYKPHPKTENGLAIAIERGERDRGIGPVQNGTESAGNGTESR